MNSTLLLTLSFLAITIAPVLRAAEISPVSLEVSQVSADKRTRTEESQEKSLKVQLTNSSAQDVSVKVKYYFFAKDVKGKEVTILKDGEKPATVKPHSTETVQTETVTAKLTAKHMEGGKGGRGGKEMPAAGQKIVGYGVQVRQDGKVLTDYFSEPSLKTNVGGDR
jgi:uncharacterized protein YcfL